VRLRRREIDVKMVLIRLLFHYIVCDWLYGKALASSACWAWRIVCVWTVAEGGLVIVVARGDSGGLLCCRVIARGRIFRVESRKRLSVGHWRSWWLLVNGCRTL